MDLWYNWLSYINTPRSTQSITLYARWEKVTMKGIKAEFLGKYLMAGTNEWVDSKDLRVTAIYTDHEEQITTGYKLDGRTSRIPIFSGDVKGNAFSAQTDG